MMSKINNRQALNPIHETQYRKIIEDTYEGIWAIDEYSRTVFTNRRMEEMLGYNSGEMQGKMLFEFMDEEGRQIASQLLDRRRQGIAEQHDFKFIRKDGSCMWALLATNPITDEKGKYQGALAMITDITERRRIEDELRKACAELERRAQEKAAEIEQTALARDEFLSIASHELKTPLTSLKLLTEMGMRKLTKIGQFAFSLEEGQKILENYEKQINRLSNLVDGMLELSRLNSGKFPLRLGPVDISTLTLEIINRLSSQLEASHCSISVDIVSSIVGNWDYFRIEQVLTNLIMNAMKYGAGKPIHISVRSENSSAILVVQDHGIGIDKKDQTRIFQKFERAVSSNEFGGLGLGLYIANQIIEAHQGTIQIESELGKGSEFTITLPL